MNTPAGAARIQSIPTSIFATMSRKAAEHRAVNLGQGFPDFDGPEWIMEAAFRAMRDGKNQYAPMPGTLALRRAVATYQEGFHGMRWDPETEITVTAGATESLFSVMLALLDPLDEVILFEPYYDSYHANAVLAGAVPKLVTLHRPDFRFREEELRAQVSGATRMIVINNPHNPTGRMFSREELEVVAAVAEEHDLLVLSDEVYEFLTFDDRVHLPFASLPGMRRRTLTVSSTGKTFGMTGWKVGFTMAPPHLTDAMRTVHQFATFAVNTPGQHAMAEALGRLESYLPEFRDMYRRKRDLLYEGLLDTLFTPHLPEGSYFMMVDIPGGWNTNDTALALRLVEHAGVAVIPPSVFYSRSDEGSALLRLCFAKSDETLEEGIRRLRGFSLS
jgi:N-succinyldiaminopimelate aminotransferase